MTVSAFELLAYAGAVGVLFLTPGPVWVAVVARGLSGGFRQAWPMALGVTLGDLLWPFLAILGVSWVVSVWGGFLYVLKLVAAVMFVSMGALLIWRAGKPIQSDGRLTKPGMWAGFTAGLAINIGNPKAILFYMGLLPGFFDLDRITRSDIAAILLISMAVPLIGNLILSLMVDRARQFLNSPDALVRTNRIAGVLLICVGLAIPFL